MIIKHTDKETHSLAQCWCVCVRYFQLLDGDEDSDYYMEDEDLMDIPTINKIAFDEETTTNQNE